MTNPILNILLPGVVPGMPDGMTQISEFTYRVQFKTGFWVECTIEEGELGVSEWTSTLDEDDDEPAQYDDVNEWVNSFESWPHEQDRQEDLALLYEAAAFLIRQQRWGC
jgi:hypothetical protein